jgi:outer membrane protein
MSANFKKVAVAVMLAMLGFTAQVVHSRDWVDVVTNPFVDPLLARPPQLDTGKTLPSDARAYTEAIACQLDTFDAAKPLALVDAVDLALCRNPQVQSAWASIKVQAAAVGEARAAYLPTITVGKTRLKDTTIYPESQFAVNSEKLGNTQFTTISWRLLDFGGRGANRRSANSLLEAALASHDATLQKTLAVVIGAYFDAQTAEAALTAKTQSEALATQTLETAKRREERGAGAQSDTLQATTALAKAALEKSRAQGAVAKANSVLAYALGISAHQNPAHSLPKNGLVLVSSEVNDVAGSEETIKQDLAAWLEQAKTQHPSIVAARAQLQAAKEKLSATRSEGLPTLDLAANQYLNGRPNQGFSGAESQEKMLMLTVNFPLFDGFSRTYKVRGAEAQIEVREAELLDTQNQVLSEVVKAHADAMAALSNLTASQKLIAAAQNAVASVQRRYDKGATDILEMLATQTSLADANQERIRTLADWRSSRLRLVANTGMLGLSNLGKEGMKAADVQAVELPVSPAPKIYPHRR